MTGCPDIAGHDKAQWETCNNKRTLIKCGWLVTLDDKIGDHQNGELLFAGNTIEAAGQEPQRARPTRRSTPPTRS